MPYVGRHAELYDQPGNRMFEGGESETERWRRMLREMGLTPGVAGMGGGGDSMPAEPPAPAGERMDNGLLRGDSSGFHPGKDYGEISGAVRFLGGDKGQEPGGGDMNEMVQAVRELRRGGGNSDESRRLLATLLGPGEASKVEQFTRNAARTGQASEMKNADLAERSARLAEIRARERSAAAEKAEDPKEAARLREAAQRLLEQAERKRKMAGMY